MRLEEVKQLVALRPNGRGAAAEARREAVNRAAVVLLCAHLEGFLEHLIGEIVDHLNASRPGVERVPLSLRAAHVNADIDSIAGMTDRIKRAQRIEALFRSYGDLWLSETLEMKLRAENLTSTMSNPGAKEISKLFATAGIEEIFSNVSLTDGSDPEKRINEFVNVRNSVAHGEDTKVTDDQVDRYIDAVECLARCLDASVAQFLQGITRSPTLPWT